MTSLTRGTQNTQTHKDRTWGGAAGSGEGGWSTTHLLAEVQWGKGGSSSGSGALYMAAWMLPMPLSCTQKQ